MKNKYFHRVKRNVNMTHFGKEHLLLTGENEKEITPVVVNDYFLLRGTNSTTLSTTLASSVATGKALIFNGDEVIPEGGLVSKFVSFISFDKIKFPDLLKIEKYGMSSTFYNTRVVSVAFPKLLTIDDYGMSDTFGACRSLTAISFPSLKTIGQSAMLRAFNGCTSLNCDISFPNLETIGSGGMMYAFQDCRITRIDFPSLMSVDVKGLYSAFHGCTLLQEIHYRADVPSNIRTYFSNGNATNASVYFDL